MTRLSWRTRWGPLLALLILAGSVAVGNASLATPTPTIDHELSVRFDPASGEIFVEDRFTPDSGDFVFDLAPWMKLVEARVGDREIEALRDGERLRLPGPELLDAEVTLSLRGTVPALTETNAHGSFLSAGTSSDGTYLLGGAGWMALSGGEAVRFRMVVEVPGTHRAIVTGRLKSEQLSDQTYSATFVSEGLAEAPSLFIGPYRVAERMAGDLRLRTYFHPEQESLAEVYLDASENYIRRFSDLIGPYPFAGFSVIAAPIPVGLGFPGLTYVSRQILPLPFMRGRSLAHEVLHNWWGNGVAADYARGNWVEGLTTYMADYALAEDAGSSQAQEMRLGWLRNLTALPADENIPVIRFLSKTHDAAQVVGYDKIALIFHMLRREIGEDTFMAGLRALWEEYRFKVAGWPALQAVFEKAAGLPLDWFFDQWLTRAGLPRVSIEAARSQATDEDQGLSLTLRQTSPTYRLRLPVLIETTNGTERLDLDLEHDRQTYRIDLTGSPLAVHIDPGFDVARKLLLGESPPIFRDVTLSRDTQVVVAPSDTNISAAAGTLAGRLLQREFGSVAPERVEESSAPLLVVGLSDDVLALRAAVLAGPAQDLTDEGTARAWVEAGPDGMPWMFVSANDPGTLQQILRPLPHYKSRSFVVFEGRKAIRKGLWPLEDSPLSRKFD